MDEQLRASWTPWVLLWTFQDDKKALKANVDVGNGCEEVEWEAELLEMPDGGVVEAYPIGAGSLIWEEA